MQILDSVNTIKAGYFAYFNERLNHVRSDIFNPIEKAYREKRMTLKEAVTLLNSKLNQTGQ